MKAESFHSPHFWDAPFLGKSHGNLQRRKLVSSLFEDVPVVDTDIPVLSQAS
jgi:hypothetical protein